MTMNDCRRILRMTDAELAAAYPDLSPEELNELWWYAEESVSEEYDRGVGPAWDDF